MLTRILALVFAIALIGSAAIALAGIGSADAEPMDKVMICHHTESETNPYVLIEVSGNALEGHDGPHHQHGLDIVLPDGVNFCPGDEPD